VSTIQDHQFFMKARKVCPLAKSLSYLTDVAVGWECCKPRVLTFDEFMDIPGCTTGTHTTVVEAVKPKPAPAPVDPSVAALEAALRPAVPRMAIATPTPEQAPPKEEADEDEEGVSVPDKAACKRKSCGVVYDGGDRSKEVCTHHPGAPIFHEGTKGWTCCKRRVMEFDEFLKIEGCTTKDKHVFVGKKKAVTEEKLETVRYVFPSPVMITTNDLKRTDFYQTTTSVIASIYLKGILKDDSSVKFSSDQTIDVDLKTKDSKHYASQIELFGKIDPEKSSFAIKGTKLEFTLAKSDGSGWPVLRSTDPRTGEIIQSGRAGTMK
jgi:hypothetical protein